MNHDSTTFCLHPFTGLATRTDGAILACCRSQPVGWIQNESLEEIWNNENICRIRQQVLNNQRPSECAACFNLEDQGVESLRQRHIKGIIPEARINLYPNALDKLDKNYKLPFEFPTIEIKINNLCNLKCRMCHAVDSTSWDDFDQILEFYKADGNFITNDYVNFNLKNKPYLDKFSDTDNWWSSFKKLLPYFRRVEFAGGEPLIDPIHYKILDLLAPYGHNIEIKYATNGTTLGISKDRTIFNYWPKFKSVAVNLSIDGIDNTYEYIRGNGKWEDVKSNIYKIKKLSNISRIVGAVAVQINNIMTIDKMIEIFLKELEIVFYTNMVNYPSVLSIQVLPLELKKIVEMRLHAIGEKIDTYPFVKKYPILSDLTKNQIKGINNFLKANDKSHLWKSCIAYNKILDSTRNQDFFKCNPEFIDYV